MSDNQIEKEGGLVADEPNAEVLREPVADESKPKPTTPSDPVGIPVPENPSTTQSSYYNPEKEIEKLREENTKEIDRINYFFIGVVVFVAITFIIQIYVTNLDRIKDKELYLKYNEDYKDYSEKNVELTKEVYNQKIEMNNYKNDLDGIKKCIKNFGFTYRCFE